MWSTASGEDKRVDYYMWAKADTKIELTAMARVAGFTASIGARLVASGEIQEKGIVARKMG